MTATILLTVNAALSSRAPIIMINPMPGNSNQEHEQQCHHLQTISQQATLIRVIKEELMRLQLVILDEQREKREILSQLRSSQDQIEGLKEKIEALRENNESLMHTFEVFQREFVKRDYKTPAVLARRNSEPQQPEGPLFFELVRSIKMKFAEPAAGMLPKTAQKSYLGEYYGYFFHEEVRGEEADLFHEAGQHKLRPAKVRHYGRKNYFNENYRHVFWFQCVDNVLKISPKQYELILEGLDSNRENEGRKTSIIDLDLRRMDFKVDEQKAELIKVEIRRCLEIFNIYRPDIGYVQGMSYLAWMLLIRMEGYEAFTCFANLVICDPFVHSLYFFQGEHIKKIIAYFQECLEDKKPKLSKHMKNLQVQSDLFVIEWAYTMFSRAFNLRLSSKVWDLWFCQGFNVFFKAAMVIMEMMEPDIMEQNQNDKIIELIRTQTHKLDETEFLKNLLRQRLFQDLKI